MSVIDLDEARAMRARASDAALEEARRALARRAMSAAEVAKHLEGKGVGEGDRERAIDTLTRDGALDDAALAVRVADRMRAKGSGWRAVQLELHRRGVAAECLDEAPDEAEELERALEMARSRTRRQRIDAGTERRLAAWLARRGYSSAICRAACERVLGELRAASDPQD